MFHLDKIHYALNLIKSHNSPNTPFFDEYIHLFRDDLLNSLVITVAIPMLKNFLFFCLNKKLFKIHVNNKLYRTFFTYIFETKKRKVFGIRKIVYLSCSIETKDFIEESLHVSEYHRKIWQTFHIYNVHLTQISFPEQNYCLVTERVQILLLLFFILDNIHVRRLCGRQKKNWKRNNNNNGAEI